ncbi:MAG: endonuclease domain-containing protein [Candidatus Methylomirabilales bacterium]
MSTEHARALRKNPTEAERALWGHIRLRQLEGCKFRRQQPLGRYIVDFVCLEKKLIIELDGGAPRRKSCPGCRADRMAGSSGLPCSAILEP